ncbi:MAG: hypothetical protein LBG99_07735 [Propionibacteriaceae bacterium]|jgi:hypothetical protein|nr:hypothetical protein [Propionibacteriaceae bacterium]
MTSEFARGTHSGGFPPTATSEEVHGDPVGTASSLFLKKQTVDEVPVEVLPVPEMTGEVARVDELAPGGDPKEPVTEVAPVIPPPEIETLPPLDPDSEIGYTRSKRTGEPKHPGIVAVASALCWASIPVTIVAYARWWWQAATVDGLHESAQLLSWVQPDPVSAPAIILVVLISLIAVLMVAAGGTAGYNIWTGQPWIRVGVLVCLAVTGLSFLLNWWFTAAMIPLALGALLLWFPQVRGFLTDMKTHQSIPLVETPTESVRYGPQPLIGERG